MKSYLKSMLLPGLLILLTLPACGPGQQITNSWIHPDAGERGPYNQVFVIVLARDKETSYSVEDLLARTIASRGQKFVLSTAVFPPNLGISEDFTRDQMAEAIRRTGCDAVLMLATLDVKSVETYHPGGTYNYGYPGYYGSYYGYYRHYYPQVYSPGYYSTDRTYYIETNFYDVEKDEHLWLIQSEAYNPESLDSWFDTYMDQLLKELERENLLAK
jgi:hypothetical protein